MPGVSAGGEKKGGQSFLLSRREGLEGSEHSEGKERGGRGSCLLAGERGGAYRKKGAKGKKRKRRRKGRGPCLLRKRKREWGEIQPFTNKQEYRL